MVKAIFRGLFLWLFSAGVVFAVDFSLADIPAQIDIGGEISPLLNFSCSSCGDSYFRGVFFRDGTTDYFGYTRDNSGNWINTAGDKTLYFKIAKDDLISGTWSGRLVFKPDTENSHYQGPGSYRFKIGRYTSANSSASWSDPVAIALLGPTPTPTPAPTSVPTHTPKPTSTPKPDSPTHTPKPPASTPVLTLKPTIKPTTKSTPKLFLSTTPLPPPTASDASRRLDLGGGTEEGGIFILSPSPTPTVLGAATIPKSPPVSPFLLASGCLFILGSALLLFRP